jgi:pimeloyl-ACP methyl ester carboxylesterase
MTKTTRSAALEVIGKGATSIGHPVPLLFVHGGCHSAWCWDEGFLDHFADRGFQAAALSLRGHGGSSSDKSLHRCSIADFVDDVDAVAVTLETPPVLIGHSMGGFIVQHYLAKHHGSAGVLMASIPPRGVLGASVRVMRKHPWSSLRSNVGGPKIIPNRVREPARGLVRCDGQATQAREGIRPDARPRWHARRNDHHQ